MTVFLFFLLLFEWSLWLAKDWWVPWNWRWCAGMWQKARPTLRRLLQGNPLLEYVCVCCQPWDGWELWHTLKVQSGPARLECFSHHFSPTYFPLWGFPSPATNSLQAGQGRDADTSRVVAVCLLLAYSRPWVLKSGMWGTDWEIHINEDSPLPIVVKVRAITQATSTV